MLRSLVGSEMCIRDRSRSGPRIFINFPEISRVFKFFNKFGAISRTSKRIDKRFWNFSVWPYVGRYVGRRIWLYVVVCGCTSPYVAVHGPVWPYVGRRMWPYVALCGCTWPYVALCGAPYMALNSKRIHKISGVFKMLKNFKRFQQISGNFKRFHEFSGDCKSFQVL